VLFKEEISSISSISFLTRENTGFERCFEIFNADEIFKFHQA